MMIHSYTYTAPLKRQDAYMQAALDSLRRVIHVWQQRREELGYGPNSWLMGELDCCQFARAFVYSFTNGRHNIGEHLVYKSRKEYRQIIRQHCNELGTDDSLTGLLSHPSLLGDPLPNAAELWVGDVCVAYKPQDEQVCGITNTSSLLCSTEEGIMALGFSNILAAWRISQEPAHG